MEPLYDLWSPAVQDMTEHHVFPWLHGDSHIYSGLAKVGISDIMVLPHVIFIGKKHSPTQFLLIAVGLVQVTPFEYIFHTDRI